MGDVGGLSAVGVVDGWLETLGELGRLPPVDAARVGIVRILAVSVDADRTNAALWRQFREAVEVLRGDCDGGGGPDLEELQRLLDVGGGGS